MLTTGRLPGRGERGPTQRIDREVGPFFGRSTKPFPSHGGGVAASLVLLRSGRRGLAETNFQYQIRVITWSARFIYQSYGTDNFLGAISVQILANEVRDWVVWLWAFQKQASAFLNGFLHQDF